MNKNSLLLFYTTLFYSIGLSIYAHAQPVDSSSIHLNPRVLLGTTGNAEKPRIVSTESGVLIIAYGDSPPEVEQAYELKSDSMRRARDVYVQTCRPAGLRTCDRAADWSEPFNVSNSARSSSIRSRFHGASSPRLPYPGDIDKVNVRAFGPLVLLSWVSKFCPQGDMMSDGSRPIEQRVATYAERAGREVPFSCVWLAYSLNEGSTWSESVQRSSGRRDALQDSIVGGFNAATGRGWFAQIWQEDPQGLLLGEAEGPGDGASGAKVNGGTDLWYGLGQVNLSASQSAGVQAGLLDPVRLTNNWTGEFGGVPDAPSVLDAHGLPVPAGELERGAAGASRPTAATSGSTVIVVYEHSRARGAESSGSMGKQVRFHAFDYRKARHDPNDPASNPSTGCVISDPARNARRARVVAQSPDLAGPDGPLAVLFWREGQANQGGPADIVLRRLVGGTSPGHLDPPVDAQCPEAGSSLTGLRAENISSNTRHRTGIDRFADTEAFPDENAIAHRALLRGDQVWLGYLYVSDLAQLSARQQAYEFWLSHYSRATGWGVPRRLSRMNNPSVNVREPRLIGTPRSGRDCPSGEPLAPRTLDPQSCQNRAAVWAAWGTQSNESPGSGITPRDLGIQITTSIDSGSNFSRPTGLSLPPAGALEEDGAAFEAQMVVRPDGRRFRSVWTHQSTDGTRRAVALVSGDLRPVSAAAPLPPTDAGISDPEAPLTQPPGETPTSPLIAQAGGCSLSRVPQAVDPVLVLLAFLAVLGLIARADRSGARPSGQRFRPCI